MIRAVLGGDAGCRYTVTVAICIVFLCCLKAAFHYTDILANSPDTPILLCRDPREDVGVVECGHYATQRSGLLTNTRAF